MRYRQPQNNVLIDWGKPLTKGLIVSAQCTNGAIPIDALCKGLYTQTSGGYGTGIVGKFVDRTGSGSIITTYAKADVASIIDFTAFFYIRVKSATLQVLFSGTQSNSGLWIGVNSDGQYEVNNSGTLATRSIDTTKPQKVCIRRTGALCEFFVDGVWGTNTDTQSTTFASGTGFAIGNFGSAGSFPASCDLYAVNFWDRALSNSELLSLTNNPWQLFKDQARILKVATGGAQSYSYSAVGGLQTGGAATKIKGRVSVASGGLQTGGAITEVRGHVPAVSGGLQTGGSANETRGHVPASSGGITLGGNVIDIRGTVPAPSGGLQLGGHANMSSSGMQSYIYSASGGLSLSGFAATIRTVGKTSSGGVVLSGAATILPTYMTQTVARPVTDTTPGAWLPSAGIDLFAMVDEVVANDADYIYATTASTCKLALNAVTDPLTSSGQVVSYRAWSPTSGGLVVKLMQGATVIATWTHVTLPTVATTYNQALTAGECDAITNYATLSVQMESTV